MTMTEGKKSHKELEAALDKALKKVKGRKENDLCKYIPVDTGGYMHHFTLKKLKNQDPGTLLRMIEKHILASDPKRVAPKPRKPRGSRKRHDLISLSRRELERVLGHVRTAGDTELISKLAPRRSLTMIKRQLTAAIRKNEIDQELWHAYTDTVCAQHGGNLNRQDGEDALIQTL